MTMDEGGARRPFLALDGPELASEPVVSFTALQRSAHLALYELANWAELPWVHHGKHVGVVRRGELTHDVRSIADHAKVSKDVAQGVIEALRRAGNLEWIEPTSGPTGEATIPATTRPTSGPTRPRKLRLVNYLQKAARGETEPTTEPTRKPTPEPTTEPTTEPTEIRKAEDLQIPQQQLPRATEPPSSERCPLSAELAKALGERWTSTIVLGKPERRDAVEAAIRVLGIAEAGEECIYDVREAVKAGRLTSPPTSLGFFEARLLAAAAKARPQRGTEEEHERAQAC